MIGNFFHESGVQSELRDEVTDFKVLKLRSFAPLFEKPSIKVVETSDMMADIMVDITERRAIRQ